MTRYYNYYHRWGVYTHPPINWGQKLKDCQVLELSVMDWLCVCVCVCVCVHVSLQSDYWQDHNKQESQGKQSSPITVHRPYKNVCHRWGLHQISSSETCPKGKLTLLLYWDSWLPVRTTNPEGNCCLLLEQFSMDFTPVLSTFLHRLWHLFMKRGTYILPTFHWWYITHLTYTKVKHTYTKNVKPLATKWTAPSHVVHNYIYFTSKHVFTRLCTHVFGLLVC